MHLYQALLARAFLYLNVAAPCVCIADSALHRAPWVTGWRIIIQSLPLEHVWERKRERLIIRNRPQSLQCHIGGCQMSSANYVLGCFGDVRINPDLVSNSKTIGKSPVALMKIMDLG